MKPGRVLIAYSSKPPIIEYLKRSFGKMGMDARGFFADDNSWFDRYVIHHVNKQAHNLRIVQKGKDVFANHRLAHLNYRSTALLEAAREYRPDLVLVIRGIRFREDVLREIRSKARLFGWWIEREERMEEAFREMELFDRYFFMNSSCVDAGIRRGFGAKISLLHHAVDTTVFHPMDIAKKYDWCFVGNWSEKRQKFIEEALKASPNGVVYGRKWKKKNLFKFSALKAHRGAYIEGAELTRLYNESRVVLNITNWGFGEGEKRSGVNMRVLEVPACGACLLTDGSRDLKTLVTPSKHVVVYDGLDDFSSKLKGLVADEAQRSAIASSGYVHVVENFTYDHAVRAIIGPYGPVEEA